MESQDIVDKNWNETQIKFGFTPRVLYRCFKYGITFYSMASTTQRLEKFS